MTLRCGSCGVNLRVPPQLLEGKRTSAKCPRCKNAISITGADTPVQEGGAQSTIRVECGSCGAKLKAPAPKAGTTSRCPRCKGTISIPAAEAPAARPSTPTVPERSPMAARSAVETSQEESGVATRRIDSRSLGMMGMPTPAGGSGEVDLDDLVRKSPPPTTMTGDPEQSGTGGDTRDIATALMSPPVDKMRKAAETIREGSREISSGSESAETSVVEPEKPAEPPVQKSRGTQPRTAHPTADLRPTPRRRFPVFRGLLAGCLSGTILGAAWMGMMTSPVQTTLENYTAPLPLGGEMLGLSDPVMRLAVLALAGALIGLLAGAIGAPHDGNALNAIRCGLFGAVAGAAIGMSGGMDPTIGFRIWPMAHWVRDLMLVGLLTPALNRIIPGH